MVTKQLSEPVHESREILQYMRRCFVIGCVLSQDAPKGEDEEMKRAVELKDILRYRFLSYPAFSPNGQFISFLVHEADPESDGYASISGWLISTRPPRQLTYSARRKRQHGKTTGKLSAS